MFKMFKFWDDNSQTKPSPESLHLFSSHMFKIFIIPFFLLTLKFFGYSLDLVASPHEPTYAPENRGCSSISLVSSMQTAGMKYVVSYLYIYILIYIYLFIHIHIYTCVWCALMCYLLRCAARMFYSCPISWSIPSLSWLRHVAHLWMQADTAHTAYDEWWGDPTYWWQVKEMLTKWGYQCINWGVSLTSNWYFGP